MSEIIWSPEAQLDLQDIYDYVAYQSEFYANQVIEAIIERTIRIADSPFAGRVVPEGRNEIYREVFQYQFRIIYSVEHLPLIRIMRVYHMKRMLQKL